MTYRKRSPLNPKEMRSPLHSQTKSDRTPTPKKSDHEVFLKENRPSENISVERSNPIDKNPKKSDRFSENISV